MDTLNTLPQATHILAIAMVAIIVLTAIAIVRIAIK